MGTTASSPPAYRLIIFWLKVGSAVAVEAKKAAVVSHHKVPDAVAIDIRHRRPAVTKGFSAVDHFSRRHKADRRIKELRLRPRHMLWLLRLTSLRRIRAACKPPQAGSHSEPNCQARHRHGRPSQRFHRSPL
jgi:hypothetical protein